MTDITPEERATLEMYGPQTHCIDLTDRSVRESLRAKGLVVWVPGQAWSGQHTYAITETGREAARTGIVMCGICAHRHSECVCTDDDRGI